MINFNTEQMDSVSQGFFAKVKQQLVDNTLESMCKYGDELMRKAYEERSWENRTFNLKDSFGWVVYNNGSEYKHGYLGTEESTKSKVIYGETMKGRSVLDAFIREYSPILSGVELVIVNVEIADKFTDCETHAAPPWVVSGGNRARRRRESVVSKPTMRTLSQRSVLRSSIAFTSRW